MSETLERDSSNTSEDSESVTEGIEVQVWSRRPVCGPRTTAIDRLTELRSAGLFESVAIETWPEEVVPSEADGSVTSTVARLEAWAERNGLRLRPPIETRSVSPLVGESYEVLTLPMLMVAVYDDGLAGVYPCTDGDRTWTVADYLAACERSGSPARHGPDGLVPISEQ